LELIKEYLEKIGAADVVVGDDGYVHFKLAGRPGRALLKPGDSRVRASLLIQSLRDPAPLTDWLQHQPLSPSSELDVWELNDGQYGLRLVWERPVVPDLGEDDPIAGEAAAFAKAWSDREVAVVPERAFHPADPRNAEPEQAWLVVGGERSWPTEQELGDWAAGGDVQLFECMWTAAKQTQVGDLVLIYFMGARKAVHFVARAASAAFYTADLEVNAAEPVADQQWWVYLTPPVEVRPLAFTTLEQAVDGKLNLKGRSGKFLRPEVIRALTFRAVEDAEQPEVDRICRVPVGRADLPNPSAMSWYDVRELAGGALRLESEVSRYIVEPLLHACLRDEPGMQIEAEYPVGKTRADYVVVNDGVPVCVIEVKLAIDGGRDWSRSPDLRQAIGYADALNCNAVLIDSSRIVLVDAGETTPKKILRRRYLDDDLAQRGNSIHDLAEHLGVPYVSRANQGGEYRQPEAWFRSI
jgi:hypothetical protein